MKIDRTGCTRIVFLTKCRAYKLPNFLDNWRLFLNGLLANMQERAFSETKAPELCPVEFSIPGGWLVIMPRCKVMTDEEFLSFDAYSFVRPQGEWLIPAELKSNSFGYLGGRIVCFDYGN